jgi:alcohol dehydrogenase class IV
MEAAEAYGQGNDAENAVRLYLQLELPEEAARIVRVTDAPDAVAKVANYYMQRGELEKSMLEYIWAGMAVEALNIAYKHGLTEQFAKTVYTHFVIEFGMLIPEVFHNPMDGIAKNFKTQNDYYRAGMVWALVDKNEEVSESTEKHWKRKNDGWFLNEQ